MDNERGGNSREKGKAKGEQKVEEERERGGNVKRKEEGNRNRRDKRKWEGQEEMGGTRGKGRGQEG